MARPDGRKSDELRPLVLAPGYVKHAHGSCFVKCGDTQVICAATIEEKVPFFLKRTETGWITAEYGMLPCAANERIEREAAKGKQSGRTLEIQRLISRSLRAAVDLRLLGERQIRIDCDVIQADGGTRTASITGGFIALKQAISWLLSRRRIQSNPIIHSIAAISCGIVKGEPLLDLNYPEDSTADVDANFVMTEELELIEIQMTAEHNPFPRKSLNQLLDLAEKGVGEILEAQRAVLPH